MDFFSCFLNFTNVTKSRKVEMNWGVNRNELGEYASITTQKVFVIGRILVCIFGPE